MIKLLQLVIIVVLTFLVKTLPRWRRDVKDLLREERMTEQWRSEQLRNRRMK